MRRLFALAAITVLLSGCAGQAEPATSASSAGSTRSGIEGVTMVDGGCTVVRPDTGCPDKPLAAKLTVTAPDDTTVITSTTSGTDGKFRIPLPPGDYILHPANLTGHLLPTAQPMPVTVMPGEFVHVEVPFDSGIRAPDERPSRPPTSG